MFAGKVEPNYYYGDITDSIWTVNIDSNRLMLIEKFVIKAKEKVKLEEIPGTDRNHKLYKLPSNKEITTHLKYS